MARVHSGTNQIGDVLDIASCGEGGEARRNDVG